MGLFDKRVPFALLIPDGYATITTLETLMRSGEVRMRRVAREYGVHTVEVRGVVCYAKSAMRAALVADSANAKQRRIDAALSAIPATREPDYDPAEILAAKSAVWWEIMRELARRQAKKKPRTRKLTDAEQIAELRREWRRILREWDKTPICNPSLAKPGQRPTGDNWRKGSACA